ncbi:MAG TPA: HNH endonuclease [Vicinamibacteria bacterium]|nr:HNH endonuclease [Vicinamibacteria bacterium]
MSPERFKITFTASGELKDKLERLQALAQEDLVEAIEAAVTERLERLEAKRYGETKEPRKSLAETDTSPKSRYVPVAVRRRVCERDRKQCTFVDENGRRCTEREGLEFHHDDPYGLGGDHAPTRIRLLCRRHNVYLAERDYGKSVMDKYRKRGGRVSDQAPDYGSIASTVSIPIASRSGGDFWDAGLIV